MVRNNLKDLLGMFPYFLNKDSTSNFYKSQSVTANQFKDIYNDLFQVYESFKVDKRLYIWKEQSVPYDYTIHFAANFPDLKSVKLSKNDTVIYTREYNVDDNVDTFEYAYTDSTVNEFETFFCDEATSDTHRNDWTVDEGISVTYDNTGTILSVDEYEFKSYFANFEAKSNTIIEFDMIGTHHLNRVRFYYKGADIRIESYLTDYGPHKFRFECTEETITLYVDDEKKETKDINNNDTSCNFILNKTGIKYRNFHIYRIANDIIPQHTFKMEVETHDEYSLVKAWPENDTIEGNEFDHDESLDEIGALHNIPRKIYHEVAEELYSSTEPPYNDRLSEDDYHYMNRIIEYMVRYHTTPLPVLEIWKEYGIESRMENREKLCLKVWDENRHENMDWVPSAWEHKDTFCDYSQKLGVYFFIQASTNVPLRRQNVTLNFLLVNSFGEMILDKSYLFDIYINDELIKKDHDQFAYTLLYNSIPQSTVSVIRVDCKNSKGEVIGSADIEIKVRGCDDADFFVSPNGSDSNNGLSPATAFKTLQKACSSVQVDNNTMIAVLKGEYTITNEVTVPHSCIIYGCDSVVVENTTDNHFFQLALGKELTLQDLKLRYDDSTHLIQDVSYANKNPQGYLHVVVHDIITYDVDIPVPLMKNLTYNNHVISYDLVDIVDETDLDGVIYDIRYEDNEIIYKEFEYTGEITGEDLDKLRNALTSVVYENYLIKYSVLGDRI